MNNNQNEAKLKASAVDFIGPLLKRLKLAEIKVSKNSQMATTIDQIRTEVLKTKYRIGDIQKWDWKLIGLFGKIERQIDSWIDDNEKRDERKESIVTKKLNDILCMLSHILEKASDDKAPDLPLEVGESSNRSYQGSKLFTDFKDLKELDVHSILCLYSLGIFPENTELEKRFVIYWWIGLGLLPWTSWEKAKMHGNTIYSGLKEKGFLESVHNGKQNQVINRCTINPTIHKWLLSPNVSNVIFSFDQSEHSSSPFFGEWFKERVHINLDKNYLSVYNVPINKELQVVHLGSWRYTEVKAMSIDHIEIENPYVLTKLSEKTTYLSLRGILGIKEIPESIGKLENLIILDLRSCHHLIKLPQQPRSTLIKKLSHRIRFKKLIGRALPQESWFNNLMVLDISGCYLLDHMPKWISELCNLEVLKGFIVGRVGKENESCQLSDLSKLKNLKKLSIRTTTDMSPKVFNGFNSLESLLILTITWGKHKIPNYSLPKNLEKLDIRCYPEDDLSKLKNCDELTKLKKLYIRGGNLTKIPSHNNWKVEILRLRFLNKLVSTKEEVRALFPNLNNDVEYVGCPRAGGPDKFPNDGSCWIKEKADNNQNEAKLKASVEGFIGPLNIQSTSSRIKKGGFLFDYMQEEEMDPRCITRIVKIIIYHGNYINGLIVDFERNDTTQCTYQWGSKSPRVSTSEVNFETNEYITSVNGHVERDDDNDSVCFVGSLVLKTNMRVYGPYGRESPEDNWKPFEFSAPPGSQIIGFHAHYSNYYVHALGVYVRLSNGTIIKKGPFLGDSGIVKSMDPTCITRIVKIMIYHGNKINGLTVYFERNGTTQCTGLWGKNKGKLDEINFKTNEYIKSVKGYQKSGILSSLALVTNLDVCGPYGTRQGRYFEHTSLHGQIISFFACVGINCVFRLGVYIQLTGSIINKGGFEYADMQEIEMDPTGITRIVKIIIYHGNYINGLIVDFERNDTTQCTYRWGSKSSRVSTSEVNFETNEYITSINGHVKCGDADSICFVSSLVLKTNLRVYGPYGTNSPDNCEPFEFSAPLGGQIIGIHAYYSDYEVNAFGVYVRQSDGTIIKNGPFLGDSRTVKIMDPTCITRIVKIRIYHGHKIDGLSVYFERNGTTQCTTLWGKNEGTLDEINFKTNEYIKSVKGYRESGILSSLVLVTNLDVYGPYGTEKGEFFEHTSLHGQIISFFASVRMNHAIHLGVYIKVPTVSKSVPCGGSGGSARDIDDVSAIYEIRHVKIRYDNTIHALSVHYELKDSPYSKETVPLWGGETGKSTEIEFYGDEYIKYVRGYVGYFGDIFTVRSLQLITNKTFYEPYRKEEVTYGPYGKEEGTPFELSAFDGKIIGFHGRSGEYLNAIGVYVKWPHIEAD